MGDCSWVSTCGSKGCRDCKDDGTAGYKLCCGGTPGPSPSPTPSRRRSPSPSPPRRRSPGPAPSGLTAYCPRTSNDFKTDYGSPNKSGSGWSIHGGGRVSSKASYNLAGGSVEFDMDLSKAH